MNKTKCLLLAAGMCLLLLSSCSAEEESGTHIALNNPNSTTEPVPASDVAPTTPMENPIDSIDPNQYGNLSIDTIFETTKYARKTEKGVELINVNNDYVSGYLLYTITSARVATSVEEMQCSPDGFLRDTYLTLDQNGNWEQLDTPTHIQEDGTFVEGYYVILVDITVENHDAARRTDLPGYYEDPYLFRADGLLFLADMEAERGDYPNANYSYDYLDYFSQKDSYPEHPCVFRLEPGETIDFTVGFLLDSEAYGGTIDFSRFRACTTSGHPDSAFVDLNLGSN